MAKTKLDPEEQELLEAYESGELESDLDADRREYLTKAAEAEFLESVGYQESEVPGLWTSPKETSSDW